MSGSSRQKFTRRGFLAKAATVTAMMPLVPGFARRVTLDNGGVDRSTAVSPIPSTAYGSLSVDEAAFTEAMVNVLCPADHLTPDGVTCGLAALIDRRLAADSEAVSSRRFRVGLAEADAACQQRFGVRFRHLADAEAETFVSDMASGRMANNHTIWLRETVYPMLEQAAFAGPVYDRYNNKVFWKLFGSLGDPTSYRAHMAGLRFEGRPIHDASDTGQWLQLGCGMLDGASIGQRA
jgi:gluconate 2-dehydrogenase gamma chain